MRLSQASVSDEEWEVVKDLAAQVANAACADDDAATDRLTQRLLGLLSSLELKYGPLPSILATRADYVSDVRIRQELLERAWRAAERREDAQDLVFISSSLAELFINDLLDPDAGRKWLVHLEESLKRYWDDDEYKELRDLQECLNRLSAGT